MKLRSVDESTLSRFFHVYYKEAQGDVVRYYVMPLVSLNDPNLQLFLQELSADYDVRVYSRYGEIVLEVKPRRESYRLNVILFILTFLSVTFTGSMFYGSFDLFLGLQFAVAVMFVLGSHEMGHFLASKRWGMKASLPYFIPFPTIIGTLGAIIKQRGVIKNRKALMEIGASGPLAGIVASIFVTYLGLRMSVPVAPERVEGAILLGEPLLFRFVANLAGFDGQFIHPVAFAGWVGMFITALNLIPVGQLDGGHVMRAMIGERAEVVSRIFPFVLLGIGFVFRESGVWFFWGLLTLFFSMQRHPKPADDSPLPVSHVLLGVLTFAIGVLCFTPVPFTIAESL
ncbi:site-2 protease family protein [Geoglobus ahangari]